LSHALNIAFFTALANSGELAHRMAELSSTTFDRQIAIARGVAEENPTLYFEIQRLNEHGGVALKGLEDAVGQVLRAVRQGDEAGFVALMQAGRSYFQGRPEVNR
jgi:chorismate mutase/prephenate dehydrogenase